MESSIAAKILGCGLQTDCRQIADRKLLFAQSVNSNDRKSRMQVARGMKSSYNGSREKQENETEKSEERVCIHLRI